MKVVVVGGGPAGLITGLRLIEKGISPLVIERRGDMEWLKSSRSGAGK